MQFPNGFLEMVDGRRVEVEDGLTIGRTKECDLVLDDHKVSRRHARLTVDHGVVEVVDLGSSNGIWLNGSKVRQHLLRPNDELRIGTTDMVFRRVDQPSPFQPARKPQAEVPPEPESGIEIIEFVDEVVRVRTRELPGPVVSRRLAGSARSASADHGVLQFSKRDASRGLLGDELSQLGGLPKFLLIMAILTASVGVAWLTMFLVKS